MAPMTKIRQTKFYPHLQIYFSQKHVTEERVILVTHIPAESIKMLRKNSWLRPCLPWDDNQAWNWKLLNLNLRDIHTWNLKRVFTWEEERLNDDSVSLLIWVDLGDSGWCLNCLSFFIPFQSMGQERSSAAQEIGKIVIQILLEWKYFLKEDVHSERTFNVISGIRLHDILISLLFKNINWQSSLSLFSLTVWETCTVARSLLILAVLTKHSKSAVLCL